MGCGSSTATSTAVQPAPKLKSTSSHSSIKETNGHVRRLKDSKQIEESSKQKSGKETTPPEANGHVLNSQDTTPNNSAISDTTSSNVEPDPVDETVNQSVNSSTATEENTTPENKERSVQEHFGGEEESPEHRTSQSKDTADEQQPVIIASRSSVGNGSVAMATSVDVEKPELNQEAGVTEAQDVYDAGTVQIESAQHTVASKSSASGENDIVENGDAGKLNKETTTSEVSLSDHLNTSKASSSGEKEMVSHKNTNAVQASNRDTSQTSLSSDKNTAPGQDQNNRKGSMTVSEFFGAPSDDQIHLSYLQQNVLPSTAEAEPSSVTNEIIKEKSPSLGGKEATLDQTIDVSDSDHLLPTRQDSSSSNDSDPGRICTVTATVRIGTLEHSLGQKTVTLTGSVFRIPKQEGDSNTPKPGDKIGIVKGDATNNESGEKLAILHGDLFAVSGESAANGLIATASIDVLSCNLREKIATITADVAPSDDPEHQSGIISGEVLAASESGSYDDKIGSLSGKVVALTFSEDMTSLSSLDNNIDD